MVHACTVELRRRGLAVNTSGIRGEDRGGLDQGPSASHGDGFRAGVESLNGPGRPSDGSGEARQRWATGRRGRSEAAGGVGCPRAVRGSSCLDRSPRRSRVGRASTGKRSPDCPVLRCVVATRTGRRQRRWNRRRTGTRSRSTEAGSTCWPSRTGLRNSSPMWGSTPTSRRTNSPTLLSTWETPLDGLRDASRLAELTAPFEELRLQAVEALAARRSPELAPGTR